MKRFLSIIIVIALLTGTAYALYAEKALFPIFVNGEELYLEKPPLAFNGSSYLPIKAISDAVGVSAEWKNSRVEITTIDIEALKNSCVMVRAGDVKGTYIEQASGVLIDYDEVLTVNHVADHTYYAIHYDDSNTFSPCFLSDVSEAKDAAILTPTDRTVKPVQIGDSDTVRVGDKVYVISCPKGNKNAVSVGAVMDDGIYDGIYIFEINTTVNSGASGGAVFNSNGELVGIITALSTSGQSNYFVPINDIRKSLAA